MIDGMAIWRAGSETPEEALVAAAKRGDREAYSILVERYRRLAFAYAYAQFRNREDADDATQEAFIRAFLALKELRGSWPAWMMRIVRNVCTDLGRKKRVRQHEPIEESWLDQAPTPETTALSEDRRRRVARALADLPGSLRVPVSMHFLSRCTYREIALALGMPESTVVGRISRGLRMLRGRLAEEEL